MGFFLYIIYSEKLDRYYIGHTEDIGKRLADHNGGISAFTSSASDWRLMHSEEFTTRELARGRERKIKTKKSRRYLEWLIAGKPE